MTYEQMCEHNPFDKYDIEVEKSVYQGSIEDNNRNFYKPFSKGTLRSEKKIESKSNPDFLKEEFEELKKFHKEVNNITI